MDHFAYRNHVLHAEDVNLSTLLADGTIPTPSYCYSTATLTRHYNVFAEALAPVNPLICYAVKAGSNIALLHLLGRLGAGADVVSQGEIYLALKAGIKAEKIVFSGVGKTAEEMRYALQQGIKQFNIESVPELELLNSVAGELGCSAPIAFRVNPDVVAGTHAKISTGHKASKFGVPISDALQLYAYAASLPHISVQGVSVHIGSQLTSLTPFEIAFTHVKSLVADLRHAGHTISTIDLGGGLGIPYAPDADAPPLPEAYGAMVTRLFAGDSAQMMFEPGRLIMGNSGILLARIQYVKQTDAGTYYILNAGMNDLMRPSMYDAYHEIVPLVQHPERTTIEATIVGPVCESSDVFASKRNIQQMVAGELLAIRTAGAYGASMSNTYNARPLPPEILVDGVQHGFIRRPQTLESLTQYQQMPSWWA